MRRSYFALPLLVLFGAASPPLKPLDPTSAWRLDYDDEQCRTVREFGSGADLVSLQLNRDGPLSNFDIWLTVSPLQTNGLNTVSIKLDGDKRWTAVSATRRAVPDGKQAINIRGVTTDFSARLDAQFASNAPVILRIQFVGREFALNLQKMGLLKAALDKCEDDLLADEGLDGPTLRNLKSRPEPINPGHWINPSEDFPSRLAQSFKSGLVTIWMAVDEMGKPSNCRVLGWLGDEAFKKLTCDLMLARAHFKPAIAPNDAPTKAYHEMRVDWLS